MIALSGFETLEPIHRSANSAVYRAQRKSDNRSVILRQSESEFVSPQIRARYRNEFTILKSIDSPYVIKAYELQDQDYSPVLVLEDFAADSLDNFIRKRDFSLTEIIQIGIQVSHALNEIHGLNIIHRDLNPSNILYNEETSEIKLIDFALATIQSPEFMQSKHIDSHDTCLFEGTLRYISPEQTGRINRVVDYRTDFYSLGVTLYELLSGNPPFVTDDSLEQVHNHIAKQPPAIQSSTQRIPNKLIAIVHKLLEKLAEDRYQNAHSIAVDLESCISIRDENAHNDTTGFELAKNDVPTHLNLSQKLFGREQEQSLLLDCFNQVATGESKVIFFTGEAGIGKSALVRELQKLVTQRRGYFVTAKYSPLDEDVPYLAVSAGLRNLIRHLLSEPEFDRTREELIDCLQGNGYLLTNLLPDLEKIIGKQREVAELPPEEAKNRLALTFARFLRTICRAERPLVVFLDDLQLIDISSIELLDTILISHKIPYLFAISSVKSGAFEADDPRLKMLMRIAEEHPEIQRIDLAPITLEATQELISESLFQTVDQVQPLAAVIHHKTGGNPFFIHEFLRSLYFRNCLYFDPQQSKWSWDLRSVENQRIAENVGVHLAERIKTLSPGTLMSLKYAACFPDKFTLRALSRLMGYDDKETQEFLQQAVDDGYLIHVADANDTSLIAQNDYQFSHTRVHQTAYGLLSQEEKRGLHQTIGNNLLSENLPAQDSNIFEIVNQLNNNFEGTRHNEEECSRLAGLNLKAGYKAKETAAYQPAFKYFRTALALYDSLPDSQYETILQLYLEASECAYLCGDTERLLMLTRSALDHANNSLDEARIHEITLQAQIAADENAEAIETGLYALKLLGVELPVRGRMIYTFGLFSRLLLSSTFGPEDSPNPNSKMQQPEMLIAMRILMQLCQVGYITGTRDVAMYILKMIQLSNKFGMAPESSFAFPLYGSLLISYLGKINAGYRFGQMAFRQTESQGMEFQCKSITLANNFVLFWKQHLRNTLEPLARAAQIGAETGDLAFSLVATMSSCTNVYLLGYELSSLERKLNTHNQTASELDQTTLLSLGSIYQQAVLNLIEVTSTPWVLDGAVYDEELSLPYHQEISDETTIANLFAVKLSIAVLFGATEEAFEYAAQARERLQSIIYTPLGPFFYFYESLALLRYAARSSWWQRSALISRVKRNQRAMKKWAQHAPMNVEHKYQLVEAEKCCLLGKTSRAVVHYDKAMALAREHGYLNEEGLASEHTGRLYARTGKHELAHYYLRKAKSCYTRWGALTKVHAMDVEFRAFNGTQLGSEHPDFSGISGSLRTSQSDSFGTLGNVLDLGSVIKASQALSGELVLDQVLKHLMQVVLENAAAHKASLILVTSGSLVQEITTLLDEPEPNHRLESIRLEDSADLPISIIQYVARTSEDLVLNDVSEEDIFTQDPYILSNKPKSILCIPVIHQTHLTGILYLENNQSIDAFSSDRLAVLKLLASQSAIAIENAKLYRQLDDSRDRYQSLYQNALEGIFEGNSEGTLISTNPAAARILGYDSPEELVTSINIPGALLFEQAASEQEFYRRLLEEGPVVGFETQLVRRDSSPVWVSISAQAIHDEEDSGNVDLVKGSIIDITERKRREEAEQARLKAEAATETKSEFLAKMSHEIRTPMNAILGYTDLALDTKLTKQQTAYLETIQNSSHNLLRVVNDILDISKIEAGKLELQRQPFRLETTFKELSDLFALVAREKDLKLVFPELSKRESITLYGDPFRIGQILINLIGNAIKFTNEGGIEVLLSIEELAKQQVKLNFAVVDTGIGIDESQLDFIFDSFSQVQSSGNNLEQEARAEHTGTGLGLSISSHLVDLMGGSLDVDSTPGIGSRFNFSVVVELFDAQLAERDHVPDEAHKDWNLLRNVRVLLVEDNLINQELAREALENIGMKVILAEDGQEALNQLDKHDFAAILMDIRMPRMNGYEATKIIRQNNKYDHIAIIALSAGVLKHEIEQALEFGFDSYISKPIAFDRLFDMLVEMTESRFHFSGESVARTDTHQAGAMYSLIDIPELDISQALRNHNGNSLLLINLLGDFVQYYQDAPQKLQQYISARDVEHAERLVHNIAGVAGSFAANDLMDVSRQLEYAISSGSAEKLTPLLQQFENHLNSLVNSIKTNDCESIKEQL